MQDDKSIVYREWAPNAVHAALIGDFSTCGRENSTWFLNVTDI